MTSLRRSPPGGTRSKPGIPMTLTTVCAVLTVRTVGFTHVAYLYVTLKVASSVGITCLQTLTRGGEKLRRSEAYLSEAQKLSHTGSFGFNVSSGEIFWSDETYNIFEHDRAVRPTLELVLQRIHPDDRDLAQQTFDRAAEARANLDFEHRLLMPVGSVKYVHVLARALETSSGNLEYVGAVTAVTEAKQAEEKIRQNEMELRQIMDFEPQYVAV